MSHEHRIRDVLESDAKQVSAPCDMWERIQDRMDEDRHVLIPRAHWIHRVGVFFALVAAATVIVLPILMRR